MSNAVEATPRDDLLSGISRCVSIIDERMFLDCIYGAAEPVRAELGLPPASPAQIRLVPPAAANTTAPPAPVTATKQSRGFFATILGSGKVETPLMPMASYSFNRGGFFTVTLKDGEVWRQVDGDDKICAVAEAGSKLHGDRSQWSTWQFESAGARRKLFLQG